MRTIFILGKMEGEDIEILYSFGNTRPDRAVLSRTAADYPDADVFASYPDQETEARTRFKVITRLREAERRFILGDEDDTQT